MLCLESVTKAIEPLDAEIIVVDNKSEDESCTWVTKFFPNVKLIANTDNLGFARGNNLGVKQARGNYLCILNPDTVVPEDCFTNLIHHYETLQRPGALGVQLIDGTGDFLKESKRNIPTPTVALKKLFGNSSKYYNHKLKENQDGPTDVLVGAFMFMKTKIYKDVDGFDEDYFMYGEDIDFSYKLKKAGYQNYYFGSCKVMHFKGESTTKDKVYLKHFFNAMYIFYTKHFKAYKTTFLMVRQLLKLSMLLKYFRLKSSTKQVKLSKKGVLVSSDSKLKYLLSKKFGIPISKNQELEETTENSLIILDTNFLSYQEVINSLSNNNSNTNKFRIKLKNFNFIIGSDSKSDKGEVILLG